MTASTISNLSTNDNIKKAALSYAKVLGWAVSPVHSIMNGRCTCGVGCSSPGKHPITKNGVLDATKDPAMIRRMWERYPWANIGVATGAKSGFFALDVDGQTGEEALADLQVNHGILPATVESRTGGGGR